jgi:hypothetical protein
MITLLAFHMIHFIERGNTVLIEMNDIISLEIIYAACLLVIIVVLFYYRFSYVFTNIIILGSCGWWLISLASPSTVVITQPIHVVHETREETRTINPLLVFELLFLYMMVNNSLMKPLSDTTKISKKSNQVPNGNILTIICGLATILSGYLGGPPIILSCESIVAINAGGKTGLSTLISGICYGITIVFLPFLSTVPNAVVSSVLVLIGFVSFGNIKNLCLLKYNDSAVTENHSSNFEEKKTQLPIILSSFLVFFLVAFTNSLFLSIVIGTFVHFFISLYSVAIVERAFKLFQVQEIRQTGKKSSRRPISLSKRIQPYSTKRKDAASFSSTSVKHRNNSYELINDDDEMHL